MSHSIKSREIFDDIEFELIQAAVRRDELGESIQAVRKFQNGMRSELLDAVSEVDGGREIVTRQMQLNEMVLAILQQMGNDLLQIQQEQRRMAPWLAAHPQPDPSELAPPAQQKSGAADGSRLSLPLADEPTSAAVDRHKLARIGDREALEIPMDARPVGIPLIGGLLHRIRQALHSVAWYYVRRLAERQGGVNQLLGQNMIELANQQDANARRIAALVARLEERDTEDQPQMDADRHR